MPADDGDEGIGTAPSLPAAIVLDDVIGAGLNGLGAIDEIALLTTPDEGHAAVPAAIRGKITDAVVRQCGRLKDRFGILQMPLEMGRNDPADVDPPISNSYAAVYLPLAQGFRPGGERHSPRPAGTTHSHNKLNPRGIKNVRDFRAYQRGRLWGARTLARDPEWKYVNVRRLTIFSRSPSRKERVGSYSKPMRDRPG